MHFPELGAKKPTDASGGLTELKTCLCFPLRPDICGPYSGALSSLVWGGGASKKGHNGPQGVAITSGLESAPPLIHVHI
jgi:hypothetical protein